MNKKALIDAPCCYMGTTRQGKLTKTYPGVDCSYNCKYCGWNPKEAKRRMKTGRWQNAESRTNAETGETVALPDGVKNLVFERAK